VRHRELDNLGTVGQRLMAAHQCARSVGVAQQVGGESAEQPALEKAMHGHILAQAVVIGTYQKRA